MSGSVSILDNSLKLPAFWSTEPELWFKVVDALFLTAKPQIKEESLKFHHVLAILPLEIVQQIRDLTRINLSTCYIELREEVIKTASYMKLMKLFDELQLGNGRPTELLDRMRALVCGKTYSEKALKDSFIRLLPMTYQSLVMLSYNKSPAEIAAVADKWHEYYALKEKTRSKKEANKNFWTSRTSVSDRKMKQIIKNRIEKKPRTDCTVQNNSTVTCTTIPNNFNDVVTPEVSL